MMHDIPPLDSLVSDPVKATSLSPDTARHLLAGLAGLLPVLIAVACKAEPGPGEASPEHFLTVEQASQQFGVPPRWLYAHKKQLPHSQPSRKVLLFPEDKLRKWFQARKTG